MHRSDLIRSLFAIVCVTVLRESQCGSLYNIRIEVTPTDGADPLNITVKENLERKSIDDPNLKPLHIKIEHQEIRRLKRGSIQHLSKLKTVEIVNTSTEVIESGAIRNLPELEMVSIRYTGITAIPAHFFDELPVLVKIWFSNNKINVIEDGAFANIPTLKRLLLGSNQLEVWKPNWIANTTNLEEIDLRFNKIQTIPKNAFPNGSKLKKIRFDYNDLSAIEPGAFHHVRRLQNLGLTYNRLTTLDPNVFSTPISVNTITIEANKLNFISTDILDKTSVKIIYLDGNPWTCSCLDRFLFSVNQRNVTTSPSKSCRDSDVPICVLPEMYSQTCLDSVDDVATKLFFEKVKAAISLSEKKFNRCFRFD